ncbi:LLM class flavin-dependent oxidoreductase [Nakamurella silvestris]|nr:LLM class flavin-dependent oxidoreductase [Nakamurella silvestris]
MSSLDPYSVAVALDGAGWHPAAWRFNTVPARSYFTAGHWVDQVRQAERGLLDFVTFEDSLTLQSSNLFTADSRTDQVRGRFDAVLLAARVAPATRHIGLVPTAGVTHSEPFHLSTGLATLDHISGGRAGWKVRVSATPAEAENFGRRTVPQIDERSLQSGAAQELLAELFGEAADAVEVVRRLWDSWEDDAVIRDRSTGRYLDRGKLHPVDFQGSHFSVVGPSITPRPPQGQPLVTALAHSTIPYELAAKGADLVYVTPRDADDARAVVGAVRQAEDRVGRTGARLRIFADLVVFLEDTPERARSRKARFDGADGAELVSDAAVLTDSPTGLVRTLAGFREAGIDGFRLRPGASEADLRAIVTGLVPELQSRGLFRRSYDTGTLRSRLGLSVPANRYAA